MEYLSFTYNLLIILLFTSVGAGFFFLYINQKEREYIWLSLLCVLFILDSALIYMTELFENFSRFYDIHIVTSATIKTLVSASIIFCILQLMKEMLKREIDLADKIIVIFYILGLFLIPLMPTTRTHLFVYFMLTQLLFIYLAFRGCSHIKLQKEKYAPDNLKWVMRFLLAVILFNLAITIEDAIVIFFYDQVCTLNAQINQRNRCEDLERIFYAVFGMWIIIQRVSTLNKANADAIIEPVSVPSLPEYNMADFYKKHELTNREQEVASLLYQGKTNQEISDALFITMGTVKIHIHNIYQKCGVERRSQMMHLMKEMER